MGTIRVRMKNGEVPGDPSAFNSYGAPPDANGRIFDRLVYPGEEFEIPDELLDDKDKVISYRHPNKVEEFITEKKHRELLYKYGGYTRNPHFGEAAPLKSSNKSMILPPRRMDGPEHAEFLQKQRDATLKFKHFNPICMELISDIPPTKPGEEDPNKPAVNSKPDITKMERKKAIEYIRSIKDENELAEMSIVLDKSDNPDPHVISMLEMHLKNLRGA